MRRIRRTALIGAAALTVTAVVGGCSGDGGTDASGRTTVTYMLPSSWASVPGFKENVAAWEKKTGNKVTLTPVPDANYDALVQARIAARSGVDIFAGQDTAKDKAAIMRPATGPWVQRLNPDVRKAITSPDGTIWGTPSADGLNATGVIYNKDVFAKAGITTPPTTLAEFQADLEKVKKTGVTPLHLAGKDGWTLLQHRSSVNAGFLGADKDLVAKLDGNKVTWPAVPGFEQEYQALEGWVKQGLTNKDALTSTYESSTASVATGRSGALINGTWALGEIARTNPDANVGFFLLPAVDGPTTLGLQKPNLLKVATFSKVAPQAQDFLNFMIAQPQAQKFLDTNPGVSAFTDVKAAKPSGGVADLQKLVDQGGFVAPFDQQSTIPQPQDDIIAAYQELIGGRSDVAGFGDRVQKAWQSAGAKAGAAGF
ncbi:ABC transporter substrate-binding protein [Streptomyces sp. NRRL F-5727]|uniref:ABC transporter substrate-binding protein n=1 Tax=Streptomyces sp. NRRL F-5727 TaxID=1463871 RepID=UPI0004CA3320|nr:ABC transporter substrate-binding protein [Streptomyces sp. NRRL F-5727]